MEIIRALGVSLILALTLSLEPVARAQTGAEGKVEAKATATGNATSSGQAVQVRNGTKIDAELASTVDARKAKIGDEVVARVRKDVKQNGQLVIHKGDRLVGHVTQVEAGAKSDAGSRIAVTFDRLVSGESSAQLNAVLTSVFSSMSESSLQEEPIRSEPGPIMGTGPAEAGPSAGSRGVAGGGVGSRVNSTLNTAGSAAGGLGATAGAAAQGTLSGQANSTLGTPARAIRLQTEAQANGGAGISSVLSTRRGDLRLESGTRVQFRVSSRAETRAESK